MEKGLLSPTVFSFPSFTIVRLFPKSLGTALKEVQSLVTQMYSLSQVPAMGMRVWRSLLSPGADREEPYC